MKQLLALSIGILLPVFGGAGAADEPRQVAPYGVDGQDVPFHETPDFVVQRMLEMAEVGENDVVYDLGSGDGRIVIAAARDFGARAVGIELDPELVALSREKAAEAGVTERVRFETADFFEADFSEATVVALFLWRSVNRELAPHLERQLPPGTRIVSHKFEIPGWDSVRRERVGGHLVYLYEIR